MSDIMGRFFAPKIYRLQRRIRIMAKTRLDRIARYEEQIAELHNRRKQELQKHREADRKARTRRLIERGAILEAFIPDAETYTEEQVEAFLKETLATDFARRALRRLNQPQKGIASPAKPESAPQGAAPAPAGERGCTEGTG